MKILIIDDCRISREVISRLLEDFGTCISVSNGQDGIAAFKNAHEEGAPFDLICVDLSMPGMDGYQAVTEFRVLEENINILEENQVKILIITGFSDEENIIKTYHACQGYLIKPLRKQKLREKLQSIGLIDEKGMDTTAKDSDKAALYSGLVPEIKQENGEIFFYIMESSEPDKAQEQVKKKPDEIDCFKSIHSGQVFAKLDKDCTMLKLGKNIVLDKENGLLSASESGMICLENHLLFINDTLTITESVKYGDIDFPGKIEIHGDVNDGIKIKAQKGLIIRGKAGACKLSSEGDIELERLNGKDSALIQCGGIFKAVFVYDSLIESRHGIVIEKEAVHSKLKSSSSIKIGAVTGGETVALDSITIDCAGSKRGIETSFKVGLDFYLADRRKVLNENLKKIEDQLKNIEKMLGPHPETLSRDSRHPESVLKKIEQLSLERRRLNIVKREYLEEIAEMSHSLTNPSAKVQVEKIVHQGTILKIGNASKYFKADIPGPITFYESTLNSD